MKIDVAKHLTLGAKRTLKAFRQAMFDTLSEKEFDKITVNDICEKSEYPRATFYNYFDDKMDLLHYLWTHISKEILQTVPPVESNEEGLIKTFNSLLSFFNDNRQLFTNIKQNNGVDSHLWRNMAGYLKEEANQIVFINYSSQGNCKVPRKLLANFYSDIIIVMLEWCLFEDPETTSKDADQYLTALLHGGL
ncbi:TetR/AcrR family transcriptional regulator [Companilactobacillus sp. FL22-1]|uniref:TetR/AcrR family transcriptional regulator n=1 Tax=Companilactobacillus sp. FL22-1 TaxID=3373892 RepID=UPI003754B95F